MHNYKKSSSKTLKSVPKTFLKLKKRSEASSLQRFSIIEKEKRAGRVH